MMRTRIGKFNNPYNPYMILQSAHLERGFKAAIKFSGCDASQLRQGRSSGLQGSFVKSRKRDFTALPFGTYTKV